LDLLGVAPSAMAGPISIGSCPQQDLIVLGPTKQPELEPNSNGLCLPPHHDPTPNWTLLPLDPTALGPAYHRDPTPN